MKIITSEFIKEITNDFWDGYSFQTSTGENVINENAFDEMVDRIIKELTDS